MTDFERDDSVLRLLSLLGDRLERYLEGDETALEHLGELIQERGYSADDLQAAVLVLRSLGGARMGLERQAMEGAPGKHSLRVPSTEERELLSPEAWGYLLDLRRRGSLDAEQFERVLDALTASATRPVGVEQARDVATRVALDFDPTEGLGEMRHGDFDLAH